MANRKRKPSELLNQKQLKVILGWNGDLMAAVRAAGYKHPKLEANRLMKNLAFVVELKRKQESMAEESGKLLGQKLSMTRVEVINRLWELALMDPQKTGNTIYGQIKATESLASVFDIKICRSADVDRELERRTSSEIDFFVEHGYFPEPPNDEKIQ